MRFPNIIRKAYNPKSLYGGSCDFPRSTRTDVSTLRLNILLIPSFGVGHPLDDSGINQQAHRIMSDACVSQSTIPGLANTISRNILENIKGSLRVEIAFTLRQSLVSKYSGSGLKGFDFLTEAYRPTTVPAFSSSIMLSGVFTSLWNLNVDLDGHAIQPFDFKFALYQALDTESDGYISQKQRHYSDESGSDASMNPQETVPTLSTHREVANFIERKRHVDLSTMAFGASQTVFKAYASHKGPHHSKAFRIKVSDTGSKRPAKGTTYNVKNQWLFTSESYNNYQRANEDRNSLYGSHRVLLALGSNVGNRIGTIEQACVEMNRRGLKILKTSSLYETEPMYRIDQGSFMNGVCEVCREQLEIPTI